MATPTVIWQTRPGHRYNFERQYLNDHVLCALPGTPRVVEDECRFKYLCSDAVVVVSCGDEESAGRAAEYLARFPAESRIALVHLSGETPGLPIEFYRRADFVLRNYYEPRFDGDPKVMTFPLGYQAGYWPAGADRTAPGLEDREFLWAFVGQLKADRQKMVRQFEKLAGSRLVYLTRAWSSEDQLAIGDVRAVYQRTQLVPCPFGWRSLDTFRVSEALEAGCLPVVVDPDGYFEHVYPGHRFLVARSWRSARRTIADEVRAGTLASRWRTCAQWYPSFCRDLRQTLEQRFAAVFEH